MPLETEEPLIEEYYLQCLPANIKSLRRKHSSVRVHRMLDDVAERTEKLLVLVKELHRCVDMHYDEACITGHYNEFRRGKVEIE